MLVEAQILPRMYVFSAVPGRSPEAFVKERFVIMTENKTIFNIYL